MSNETHLNIRSYEDLINAKTILKSEIKEQEDSFMNNPVFKISSSLFAGGSLKSSFEKSFETLSIDDIKKTGENLLGTFLMANKRTRKFYIAFVIAREMVPFLFTKINEVFKPGQPTAK